MYIIKRKKKNLNKLKRLDVIQRSRREKKIFVGGKNRSNVHKEPVMDRWSPPRLINNTNTSNTTNNEQQKKMDPGKKTTTSKQLRLSNVA